MNCIELKSFFIIVVLFLLLHSCKGYTSPPYDEWETKLREAPVSKVHQIMIKENWQKYDSLSYLRFTNLDKIGIDSDSIPPWITRFESLRLILCYNRAIKYIPDDLYKLTNLEVIYMIDCEIEEIPSSLSKVKKLKAILLSGNKIRHIPEFLTQMDSLCQLSLADNELTEVPDYICRIKGMESLSLSGNKITKLPDCIGDMKNLTFISVDDNQLTELPDGIADLPLLEDLFVSGNPLTKLPEELFIKPNKLTDISLRNTLIEDDKEIRKKIRELSHKNWLARKEQYLKEQEELRNKK